MAIDKRLLTLSILFLAALSLQKVDAQEELPPLDKTVEWLRAKITNSIVLNPQLIGKKPSKQQATGWSLDNPSRCILVWKGWKPEEKGGREAGMPVSVEINLADFDPQKINTGSFTFGNGKRTETFWTVFVNTTDNKTQINWRSSNASFYSSFISFRFNDKDVADGVIRAFQHAIKLCGGKSSPETLDPFIRKKKNPLPPRF